MTDDRRVLTPMGSLVLLGVALYACYHVRAVLAPFVLAAAFAYVVNPAITYFEARGMRRSHLVVIGYLAMIFLGVAAYAGVKTIIIDEVERLGANAPAYIAQLQKLAVVQVAKL